MSDYTREDRTEHATWSLGLTRCELFALALCLGGSGKAGAPWVASTARALADLTAPPEEHGEEDDDGE